MRFVKLLAPVAVATLAVVGCQNRFHNNEPRAADQTGTSGSYTVTQPSTAAPPSNATAPSSVPSTSSSSSDNQWQSTPSTSTGTGSSVDQSSTGSSVDQSSTGSSVDQSSTGTGSSVDLPSGVAPDATEYGTPATSSPSSTQQPSTQPSSQFEQGSQQSLPVQKQVPDTSRTMP